MKKRQKNFGKGRKIFFGLLFLLGFLIMIYPIISNQYYRIVQEGETLKFIKAQSKLDDAEIKERLELAKAYNETLDPSRLSDPYTDKEKRGLQLMQRCLN